MTYHPVVRFQAGDGQEFTFGYDPARYITADTMEVIVDPRNLKRYAMEIRFLPKLAG